mmetsp:Transcript_17620/g.49139  ORF Transcript_17620/g.49139 Transcript_17620/m.49139 type:complete len:302 (-) Transcript_17620:884-1789(-)
MVVICLLLVYCLDLETLACSLLFPQHALKVDGSIVCTEHLDAQPLHDVSQDFVQVVGIKAVKHLIPRALLLAVDVHMLVLLYVGIHNGIHLMAVLVTNGVLSEEVELQDVGGNELHVFVLECAAAHGLRLVFILFVASSQRHLVNEVQSSAHLTLPVVLVHHVRLVVIAHLSNDVFELAGLLVLGHVTLCLEGGSGPQEHILEVLMADGVAPVGQPGYSVVMPHLFPALAWVGVLWDGLPLPYVDGDVLRVDALLDHAHLWVLTTPSEQRGRLHTEVAHRLCSPVHKGCLVLCFCCLLFLL